MRTASWPVTLTTDVRGRRVELRPMHPRRDRAAWDAVRVRNRDWTGPWDSTSPYRGDLLDFRTVIKDQNAEAAAGRMLPWVLTVDGELAGQVHVFTIVRGAQQGGTVGYWISRDYAGLGITPAAVALAMDYAFGALGLHRLEVNIRPENANSLRVVEKLGLRDEGVRKSFLHIAGQWRDHRTFAMTADEVGEGGLRSRLAQ